jgi:hypothetical protein
MPGLPIKPKLRVVPDLPNLPPVTIIDWPCDE